MKNINLINALSAHQQREIRRWVNRTIFVSICTVISLCIISLHQRLQLNELRSEREQIHRHKQNFDSIMAHNNTLHQEQQTLSKHIQQITQWHNQMNPLLSYLSKLASMQHNKQLRIESVSITDARFEITAQCARDHDVIACMQELANLDKLNKLQLASLRPTKVDSDAYIFQAFSTIT